ncbi:MAG: diacylglycerol kinase family lipid kinase [Clostridia bacterium]|nr:diacylglycerol kinase family lipid kinase [Clostridia bacterium]
MLYFIVNALSGKGKGAETAENIKTILEEKGVDFQMHFTSAPLHAITLAKELSQKSDCEGVVAVGGDGTFSEVLNGIELNVPLGVVSSGSGNDFMRTFAPNKTVAEQLQPIIENKTKRIDYIQVNDMRCLNVSGTGFDVDILLRERKLRKVISGSLSYYASLIITLFTLKFRRFRLKIDDSISIDEPCLIVALANGRYFGGGMPVSLDSEIDDGFMDLLLVKKLPFYRIPDVLLRFLQGKIKTVKKYVDIYRCRKVEGSVNPLVEFQLDGELHSIPSFRVELKDSAISVFAE